LLHPWQINSYDCLSSTMDQASLLLTQGLDNQTRLAITAQAQTKGRGRYQRVWVSETGNLYLSLLFKPIQPFVEWHQITFVASLAVLFFINDLLQKAASITLKWPNDVVLDGQKVSGILLEIHHDPEGQPWLVVGIGLNITSAPVHTSYPATFLQKYNPVIVNSSIFVQQFLQAFDDILLLWHVRGFAEIRKLWLMHAAQLGAEIEVNLGNKRYHGRFLDLDMSGKVLLETKNGLHLNISAGDVFF
jgi:BirA family biotin operon repressor/biotin-[acetyl-CoA-carboxylase] ligase